MSTNQIHPHAAVVRALVLALLKLPKEDQREHISAAGEHLGRHGAPVASLHDFITAEPDAILTFEAREKLLGVVARAFKENDLSLLQAPTP